MNTGRTCVALSVLLTAATIAVLVRWLDLGQVVAAFRAGDLSGLFMGLALFALANGLKAERLRLVTASPVPIRRWRQYGLVSVYNLISTMIPAGIGELSYPAMLRAWHATPVAAGLAAVGITRVLDLLVVATCLAIALGTGPSGRGPAASWIAWFAAVVALLAVAALVVVASPRTIRRLADGRVSRALGPALDALDTSTGFARTASRPAIGILTLAIWTTGYLSAWQVVLALGSKLDLRLIVLCSSLAVLLSALPFKGFLGFGTQHSAWVVGLALVGWPTRDSLQLAAVVHIVVLAYTVILGGIGAALMFRHRDVHQEPAQAEAGHEPQGANTRRPATDRS